jgi:hypothetical protein
MHPQWMSIASMFQEPVSVISGYVVENGTIDAFIQIINFAISLLGSSVWAV